VSARRHEVVVAGGGLPGLAVAAALAQGGVDVALADRAPVAPPAASDADAAFDNRIYAVSPGSVRFLERIGAWQHVPRERIEAVESMRVEGDRGAVLHFSAYDLGERALAWIVEERAIRAALSAVVAESGVTLHAPAEFRSLAFDAAQARIGVGEEVLEASLVVAADGVRSWVRQAAGMTAEPRAYTQTAVVANFACERAHQGCARQWFRPDGGVLAWLPLPGRRISIVWSAPEALAADLIGADAAALARRVAEAGANALGTLTLAGAPAAFPLQYLRLPAVVAHRLALVGDAAHGVHPLAGQGVNLGFGDAQALAEAVVQRGPVGDPGAPIVLERYARRRAEPVLAVQAVTDGLARLFGARSGLAAALRNAGLSAVDRLPMAKYALAQPVLR
jgi:2-octaprenyl-6-methoxyphenol hydroxylase